MKIKKETLYLYMLNIYFITSLFPSDIRAKIFPISINYILFSMLFFLNLNDIKKMMIIPRVFTPIILIFLFYTLSITYTPDKQNGLKQLVSLFLLLYVLLFSYKYIKIDQSILILKSCAIVGVIYLIPSYLTTNTLVDYQNLYIGLSGNRHNSSFIYGFITITMIAYYLFKPESKLNFLFLISALIYQYLIFITKARIGFFIEFLFLLLIFTHYTANKKNFSLKISVIILICTVIYLISLTTTYIQDYYEYTISRGTTGRDEINRSLYSYQFNQSYLTIIFGFGIGSLEYFSHLSESFIRDANNIVATVFSIGLIGLLPYFTIFTLLISSIYSKKNNIYTVIFSCLALSIFLIPSETTWINFNDYQTVYMYIYIILAFKSKEIGSIINKPENQLHVKK